VEPVTLADIDHVTARGIEGRWQGRPVRLGRYSFVEPLIPVCFRNRVREVLEKIQDRGHVAVTVAAQGPTEDAGQAAVLIMADSVRPGAHELVQSLHALGIRPVRMLTGDNALTARKVASALKLDSFDADLLPEQKLEIINAMRAGPPAIKVGIIGDGVNDAPALAAADASIAIGGIGAAAALESADSVLMTDDLSAVPWVITLARRTKRIIIFNLVFALSVIALMVVATLVGAAVGRPVPLSLGVLAHEGGTILVVLNSLRLLRMPGFVVASAEAANQGEPSAHARTARG
jgi:Cd2+/Zn2+-exporting ATPase